MRVKLFRWNMKGFLALIEFIAGFFIVYPVGFYLHRFLWSKYGVRYVQLIRPELLFFLLWPLVTLVLRRISRTSRLRHFINGLMWNSALVFAGFFVLYLLPNILLIISEFAMSLLKY